MIAVIMLVFTLAVVIQLAKNDIEDIEDSYYNACSLYIMPKVRASVSFSVTVK